jgi:hypothetical protein
MSFFVVYLMGNVTTWRIAAGISASLPVITALYVTQVPEYSTANCVNPQNICLEIFSTGKHFAKK